MAISLAGGFSNQPRRLTVGRPAAARSAIISAILNPVTIPSSTGAAKAAFLAAVAVIAVVLILGWMRKLRDERMQGAALALILGGAVGNLYDRVVLGHVVDFLDFYWGDYHFPAFNIADTAITIGAALIILDMLLGGRRGHD